MVLTHSYKLSPFGPAVQLHGGSSDISASSFCILFALEDKAPAFPLPDPPDMVLWFAHAGARNSNTRARAPPAITSSTQKGRKRLARCVLVRFRALQLARIAREKLFSPGREEEKRGKIDVMFVLVVYRILFRP